MKISYFLIGLFIMTGLGAAAQVEVTVGAARTDQYVEQLQGKRIALFSNHTGVVGDRHTVDVMLSNGLNVTLLLSPEHGFRGTADAGEHVASGVDAQTGIAVFSLYNPGGPGIESVVDQFDVIVCDIQDVGLRFYTYYCTMLKLMRTASSGRSRQRRMASMKSAGREGASSQGMAMRSRSWFMLPCRASAQPWRWATALRRG